MHLIKQTKIPHEDGNRRIGLWLVAYIDKYMQVLYREIELYISTRLLT